MSKAKGKQFEEITKAFFEWLLDEIGLTILKGRTQFSGTQDGFDVQIVYFQKYVEKNIFIECKDYKNDLNIGNIISKIIELEINYTLTDDDLFLAINSKSIFANKHNYEKIKPFFQSKFGFPIKFLDSTNKIKDIFALNEDFYKEIYGEFPEEKPNKEKTIERFRSILFSTKTLKPIILKNTHKESYLGNVRINPNYISRRISQIKTTNEEENTLFHLIDGGENKSTLETILETNNKIVLLGNPGLGKTTELSQFALNQWKTGEQTDFTPIFIDLKNFTITNEILDFLPKEFSDLPLVYLILDGLDEIADIEDFKSKLLNFINYETKGKRIKYIISCRTNVYEKLVYDIEGFKAIRLEPLDYYSGLELLKRFSNKPELIDDFDFTETHYTFLENPFSIKLLVNYINQNKTLPNSQSLLWKNYIDNRLNDDDKRKLKKRNFKVPIIKKYSKKVSIIMELMEETLIKEDNLVEVFPTSKEFNLFIENPFIDKKIRDSYFFEHKNIQEYFAASFLMELELDELIKFITIPGFDKTNPKLSNTITFLLNLIEDKEKLNSLEGYLLENEPEILFNADSERVSTELKIHVFQNYFERTCIDKTFWVDSDGPYSIQEIGYFADCTKNLDYLISIINAKTSNLRAVTSAIELLAFMTIPNSHKTRLEELLIEKLEDYAFSNEGLAITVLNFLRKNGFYKLIKSVYPIVNKSKFKGVHQRFLGYLDDSNKEITPFFEFVYQKFSEIYGLASSGYSAFSNFYGIDEIFKSLINKIKDSNQIFIFLSTLLSEKGNYTIEEKFQEIILLKSAEFVVINEEFWETVYKTFLRSKSVLYKSDAFIRLIKLAKKDGFIIEEYFQGNIDYDLGRILTAPLVSKTNIFEIIKFFRSSDIPKMEIEYYRNYLSRFNFELAFVFQQALIKTGFKFNELLKRREDIIIQKKLRDKEAIKGFKTLFKPKELLASIKEVYFEIGKEDITWNEVYELRRNKQKEQSIALANYPLQLLLNVLNPFPSLSVDDVKGIIKGKTPQIFLIKDIMMDSKNANINSKELYKYQKVFIEEWVEDRIKSLPNKTIREAYLSEVWSSRPIYGTINSIYFFQDLLKLTLPTEFFLDTLILSYYISQNDETVFFEKLKFLINDDIQFERQILNNIAFSKETNLKIDFHLEYAIKNELKGSYDSIKDLVLYNKVFFSSKLLKEFFSKTGDIDFIKECCQHSELNINVTAVNFLIDENIEKEFLLELSRLYVDSRDPNIILLGIGILFNFNKSEAFDIYLKHLQEHHHERYKLNNKYYSNYANPDGLTYFKELFILVFLKDKSHTFVYSREILTQYVKNLSLEEKNYKLIQRKLTEIKDETIDQDPFYINDIIKISENTFLNQRLRKYSFKEAKKIIDELE